MKILQIINSLSTGGAEKLVLDSVPLYQEKGIEMDVLSLKDEKTPFWEKLEKTTSGEIFGLTKGSVYNPFLIFKIIPYLKRYDLIHAHLFPVLYWVVLAKWISFSKTKIAFTEHCTKNKRMNYRISKILDILIYKGIDCAVTLSEEVGSALKRHLNDSKNIKFKVIPNGINLPEFTVSLSMEKSIFFSDKDFILIQVSGFRKQKDQPTLIKSLNTLPQNIKLILVGDGPLRRENENLVINLKLQNRVKFLGIRKDIPELLKTSDVVILSSHFEGLSLSCLEGMASKPFIASNVPGLGEIVEGYGLLFEEENDKDLSRQILRLYNDKEFYKKVGCRCLERAKEFDINKTVDQYIEVYNELLT